MTVNPFGPYTLEEELHQRAFQISHEILRAHKELADAQRKADAAQNSIDVSRKLQADYVALITDQSDNPAAWRKTWAEHTKQLDVRINETMNPN